MEIVGRGTNGSSVFLGGRPQEENHEVAFIHNRKAAHLGLRVECLNQHWFRSVAEARDVTAAWREEYNTTRPHSSLDDVPPEAFAARWLAAART